MHFVPGVGNQVFALGGEPYLDEIALRLLQDVRGLGQRDIHLGGGLLDLLLRLEGRAVVGHGGGHDQGVGAIDMTENGVAHLLRGSHLDHSYQRRVRQAGGGGYQNHFSAPVPGRLGQSVPHFSRRMVGDDPHRVDGLHGPPGAHHDGSTGEVALTSQGGGYVSQ